jgi:hypothetical protein
MGVVRAMSQRWRLVESLAVRMSVHAHLHHDEYTITAETGAL